MTQAFNREYHAVKNGKTYCVYAEKGKPSPELTAQLKKAGYKIVIKK